MYAEKTEEPATEHTADNSYNKIYHKTEAASAHKLAGNEAWKKTDKYKPDKWHDFYVFKLDIFMP